MFIFTCQIFARQLVFPVPPDNNWPLQKTTSGCTPWQKISDPSKSLTEVVLSWIAFLNGPIRWEDGNAAVILCWYGHILNFYYYYVSSLFSHLTPLYPQTIQPVWSPPVPRSISLSFQSPPPYPSLKNTPYPKHQCPGQLSCEWTKGMVMAPCWAFLICSTFYWELTL